MGGRAGEPLEWEPSGALIPGGGRHPPFSMSIWGALSTTLNQEAAEDKGGEKSRGASVSPHGAQGTHNHLPDELEMVLPETDTRTAPNWQLPAVWGMWYAQALATLHIEGTCIPSVRTQETPASAGS